MKTTIISDRVEAIEASGIRKVFDLGAKIKDAVDLSIGRPHFGVPSPIKDAAIKAINSGFNTYTPNAGLPSLREKIAQKLMARNSINAKTEEVMVTSGTSGGIFLAMATLLNPGDEVILFDPYFVSYLQLSRFFGATPKFVDIYPDFKIDPEKLKKAVTKKTKAIIINSPSNPTGTVISTDEIKQVVEVAQKYGLTIISDEVYEDFLYGHTKRLSPASIYPQTVTLYGFSKNIAASGWRVGYLHAPAKLVDQMTKLQTFTFVCAPSLAQVAINNAFEHTELLPHLKEYEAKRDFIYNGLKDAFDVIKPQGAFYIFPKVPKGYTGQSFCEKLVKNKVLTVPGNVFSQKDTHFRISFANTHENLKRGIGVIKWAAQDQ